MYIHSICSINTLGTINTHTPLPELTLVSEHLDAVEPSYAPWIPPMQLRRMSKGLRMGLTAAKSAINDAGVAAEDLSAITVGTAYGMLRDSETFLGNMVRQNETMLNPTAFIQSTHNTIAGAIALSIQCNVHNMTFVHKAQSFESALLDADMKLKEHPAKKVVLGAVDEKNDTLEWLLKGLRQGIEIGEGASFMVMGNTKEQAIAQLTEYSYFKSNDPKAISAKCAAILDRYAGTEVILVKNYTSSLPVLESYTIVDMSPVIGYNPTGSAMAMVYGIKLIQEHRKPVIVINSCRAYWSIFELAAV
ncbi:beta-ketoacyl synthase chain length factor [Taibaiella sp. KBW10]|uniref:beta-ketoacyl synthase chain length factor n=1 Tax=Taibaiella sp. KBW10 TaxID=2153357 RepID=UPI0013156BF1|nr:beta-ketoacyl synthase chain length factor [Taibaiella sp. KBW10]